MIKTYVYSCLLSALCIVGMMTLDVSGRVGENVMVRCSDWNTWVDVKSNVKYLCESPCKDKDIIVKAAYDKTERKNRIELTNSAEGLFVTFTNLQKSDAKKYQCRVERYGYDSYTEVNLQVTDAEPSSPKTTPTAVTDASTLSFAVTNIPTSSSDGLHIITDPSTAYIIHSTTTPTPSATPAGHVLYLVIGVIVIVATLLFLLTIMKKMMKKQLKVASSASMPQEHAHEDVQYDEIIQDTTDTDVDGLYANYTTHQDTELAAERGNNLSTSLYMNPTSCSGVNSTGACAESSVTGPPRDSVYSLVKLPKEQIEPTRPSEPNRSEIYDNDTLYSLAQL